MDYAVNSLQFPSVQHEHQVKIRKGYKILFQIIL